MSLGKYLGKLKLSDPHTPHHPVKKIVLWNFNENYNSVKKFSFHISRWKEHGWRKERKFFLKTKKKKKVKKYLNYHQKGNLNEKKSERMMGDKQLMFGLIVIINIIILPFL